jgi:(2Fe-2S) ferredoxin
LLEFRLQAVQSCTPAEAGTPTKTSAPQRNCFEECAMSESSEKLAGIAEKLLIGQFHRHVFLCIGESCCTSESGQAAWDRLKDELKARNLSLATGPNACYRTKVGCLRICAGGPILVVYPEGTWYAGMTADRIPRFVQEHLVDGKPIEEWIIARNPLPNESEKQ